MSEGEWPRSVPCEDSSGRERAFQVFIAEGSEQGPRVALVAPPGEVGLISAAGVNALKQALTAAQMEVIHRGRLG